MGHAKAFEIQRFTKAPRPITDNRLLNKRLMNG